MKMKFDHRAWVPHFSGWDYLWRHPFCRICDGHVKWKSHGEKRVTVSCVRCGFMVAGTTDAKGDMWSDEDEPAILTRQRIHRHEYLEKLLERRERNRLNSRAAYSCRRPKTDEDLRNAAAAHQRRIKRAKEYASKQQVREERRREAMALTQERERLRKERQDKRWAERLEWISLHNITLKNTVVDDRWANWKPKHPSFCNPPVVPGKCTFKTSRQAISRINLDYYGSGQMAGCW